MSWAKIEIKTPLSWSLRFKQESELKLPYLQFAGDKFPVLSKAESATV